MGLPGRLRPKPHRSGCDQEPALGLEQPLVAVGSVAVMDVVGHRLLDGHPVGVVGVVDDELVDRPEVTLDPVQEAGVGGGEHELDVVVLGPLADVRGLVGGEVVGDQVDPDLRPVAHPDLAVERQDLVAALVRAQPAVQTVGVHVVGAEQVAHPAVLAVGRSEPLGPFLPRPAGSLVGDQLDRPHLIEADNDAVLWTFPVQAEDAFGLGLEVRVRTPLPRTGPLVREPRTDQRLAQRLLRQDDPHPGQMRAELGQRPSRQRHALGVRAGARDRHDPVTLRGRGLPGTVHAGGVPAAVVRQPAAAHRCE